MNGTSQRVPGRRSPDLDPCNTYRPMIMPHEFDGKKYEKASGHQRAWGAGLIAELNLEGCEHVLDLGCGDGSLPLQIAELLPHGKVLGIDASQGMIDAARSKETANLSFHRLDINAMDFEDRFDLVFSNAALHWVPDHHRLLAAVHRALRPGGRVRFNFAAHGNCGHFFRVVREAMAREEFRPHFAPFQWPWYMPAVADYRVLAESSELKDTRVWGENADLFFADAEAMIRWVDQPSLVPFLAHIPEGAKATFREFVVKRMIEETQQEDGRCFETFRRVNLSAGR